MSRLWQLQPDFRKTCRVSWRDCTLWKLSLPHRQGHWPYLRITHQPQRKRPVRNLPGGPSMCLQALWLSRWYGHSWCSGLSEHTFNVEDDESTEKSAGSNGPGHSAIRSLSVSDGWANSHSVPSASHHSSVTLSFCTIKTAHGGARSWKESQEATSTRK